MNKIIPEDTLQDEPPAIPKVVFDFNNLIAGKRLEVISYKDGALTGVSYLELKNGDYFLFSGKRSPNSIHFPHLAKTKLFSIKRGKIVFHAISTIVPSSPWGQVSLAQPFILTQASEQVSLRLVDLPPLRAPALSQMPNERSLRSTFVMGSFAVHVLMIIFINFVSHETKTPERPQAIQATFVLNKPTATVYVPPPVAPEAPEASVVAAAEPTSTTENTGLKKFDNPSPKVEFAKGNATEKVVAKASAPGDGGPAKIEGTTKKAYEFKSGVVNSIIGNGPKIKLDGGGDSKVASGEGKTFNSGSTDTGKFTNSSDLGVTKFNGNGSDTSGTGLNSYGSKGLATKKGFDSAYLVPNTVVLGSMDPELLRTILREYIPQFRGCYQQELATVSDRRQGVIDLDFTIGASGNVVKYNVKLKNSHFSLNGKKCMGRVLAMINFPQPKGGGIVDVRQPLNFMAESSQIR